MKKLKLFLNLIIIFSFVFALSSCSYNNNSCKVKTNLKISSSGSGTREISVIIPENTLKNEDNKNYLKKIINENCPKELSCVQNEENNSLVYVFYLNFNDFDDYKTKVNSILGFDPGTIYSNKDNLFTKTTLLCENFSSVDILNWLKTSIKASTIKEINSISLNNEDTFVNLNGLDYRTDNYINLNLADGYTVDEIDIDTQNNDDVLFDRTFTFKIPFSTIDKLGEENIKSYFNARAEGCSNFSILGYKTGNEYIIEFKNINSNQLLNCTNSLFNCSLNQNISYKRGTDFVSLFTNENSFDETLDLSSYQGKNNANVDVKYSYFISDENKNKIFDAQNYSKGNWAQASSLDINHCEFNFKTASARINITNGNLYEFSKCKIRFNILGDDYFSKYFDFYFDKNTIDDAVNNIDLYLKNKNSLFSIEKLTDYGNDFCRLEFKGNSKEITDEEIKLLGEGNTITINKNKGKFYSIHNVSNLIDTFDLTKVINDNNLNKELTYEINSSLDGYLGDVNYKSDNLNSKKVNIKQTSNKDISFNPKSYKSTVTISSYTSNFFGVFIIFLVCISFIILVILIIFKIKRNKLKLPKIKIFKNPNKPNKTPTKEEINDILKDI